jgi:hypothetical protein
MERGVTWRILLCVICAGLLLYSYIDAQNALTRLRLQIPVLSKQIRDLHEENTHLTYDIRLFESPQHLLELAAHPSFSHLKQPLLREIITMPQGVALQVPSEETQKVVRERPRFTLAIGAKQ